MSYSWLYFFNIAELCLLIFYLEFLPQYSKVILAYKVDFLCLSDLGCYDVMLAYENIENVFCFVF